MLETHPFGDFIPPNTKYLILGSFTGKEVGNKSYDWFYGTKRNQFWRILEAVYNLKLRTKKEKQHLFIKRCIAITDIIYQCERKKASNLDVNLTNITYNTTGVENVFRKKAIEKVFFSSRFVEKMFRKMFNNIITKYKTTEFITLPSPSPRYAAMSKEQKIKRYKELLPIT